MPWLVSHASDALRRAGRMTVTRIWPEAAATAKRRGQTAMDRRFARARRRRSAHAFTDRPTDRRTSLATLTLSNRRSTISTLVAVLPGSRQVTFIAGKHAYSSWTSFLIACHLRGPTTDNLN